MHRTRTTVKILMGVAVSAVSATVTGCVAVEPRPDTDPVPSADAAPLSPGQDVKPQVVQAPAREALDAALRPSKRAAPRTEPRETPAVRRTAPPAPPRRPAEVPAPVRPRAPAVPVPPEAAVPVPRVLPSLPAPPAGAGGDVCALGEGYGGWQHDSTQARICRQTYGP
ncbi:hypothetical protein [Streptomyces flavidovirens]|uniref:hypothetical protein n=1 Tax=Streptomyces flavidovirens TaxID=67298 RepID=UPI00099687A9|nr:hypothetical protein [Streptomyces flavidovirens]